MPEFPSPASGEALRLHHLARCVAALVIDFPAFSLRPPLLQLPQLAVQLGHVPRTKQRAALMRRIWLGDASELPAAVSESSTFPLGLLQDVPVKSSIYLAVCYRCAKKSTLKAEDRRLRVGSGSVRQVRDSVRSMEGRVAATTRCTDVLLRAFLSLSFPCILERLDEKVSKEKLSKRVGWREGSTANNAKASTFTNRSALLRHSISLASAMTPLIDSNVYQKMTHTGMERVSARSASMHNARDDFCVAMISAFFFFFFFSPELLLCLPPEASAQTMRLVCQNARTHYRTCCI